MTERLVSPLYITRQQKLRPSQCCDILCPKQIVDSVQSISLTSLRLAMSHLREKALTPFFGILMRLRKKTPIANGKLLVGAPNGPGSANKPRASLKVTREF